MASPSPPPPSPSPPPDPGIRGCLAMLISLTVWTIPWLGASFLFFWKVGETAGAAAFLIPPLALSWWVLFRPSASKEPDLPPTPEEPPTPPSPNVLNKPRRPGNLKE